MEVHLLYCFALYCHVCNWAQNVLGNLSGGFGGPYMYVFSPSSTKPKYKIIKLEKKCDPEVYTWKNKSKLSDFQA